MRIGNIIEEGRVGGPQYRIVRVAAALAPGIHTTVLMPRIESEPFQMLCREQDIPYVTLPMTRLSKSFGLLMRYLIFFPYEVLQIARYLKQEKFDLVHVSGGSWQYKGAFAAALVGIPSLWHLNDTYVPTVIRLLIRMFGRLSNGYIYASVATQQYYSDVIDQKKPAFPIPAPVNCEWFNPDAVVASSSAEYPDWAGKVVIGCIANVNPVKGLEHLLVAAEYLRNHDDDMVVAIVGDTFASQSAYADKLNRMLDEKELKNVQFLGPAEDVRPFLKRVDIYVCSSIAESSPMSVWEAMSMSKPIVSADVGDVSRYVTNEENGYIVPIGDGDGLGERILHLSENRHLIEVFGKRSREIALTSLDLSICASRHAIAYRDTLSRTT